MWELHIYFQKKITRRYSKNQVIFLSEVKSYSANELEFKNDMKAKMKYTVDFHFPYVILYAIVQKTAWGMHDSKL